MEATRRSRRCLFAAAALSGLLGAVATGLAEERFWIKAESGQFGDSANWSDGVVPGPLDSATHDEGTLTPYTVRFDSDAMNDWVRIGQAIVEFDLSGSSGGTSPLSYTVSTVAADGAWADLTIHGGTLAADSAAAGIAPESIGLITVLGTSGTLLVNGALAVGVEGSGFIYVEPGAEASVGSLAAGVLPRGAGLVYVTSAAMAATGEVSIGVEGSGDLQITEGAVLTSAHGTLGSALDSAGSARVEGAGSAWRMLEGRLVVGDAGAGALVISDGGEVSDGWAVVGASPSLAESTVAVDGATWASTYTLQVGIGGAGTVTITNGGLVSAAQIDIGGSPPMKAATEPLGQGLVQIEGEGATLSATNSLNVGLGGSGILVAGEGAHVNAGNAGVGTFDGMGVADISGPATEMNVVEQLFVGVGGMNAVGSLTVSGGARLTSGMAVVGAMQGQGQVTLSGATWKNATELAIGLVGGYGSVRLEAGSALATGPIVIGGDPSGGELGGGELVVGPGSTVDVEGDVIAGPGSTITLESPITVPPTGGGGGRLSLAPGTSSVVEAWSLQVGADALLELQDDAMILHSEAALLPAVQSEVFSWVADGRVTGLTADPIRGLAVLINDDGAGNPLKADVNGHEAYPTDVLVLYLLHGDSDASGILDGDDYYRADMGFLSGVSPGYAGGDVNYDEVMDGEDYLMIDRAYLRQYLPVETGGVSAVPEPGLLLVPIGAMALALRRRR